MSRHDYSDDIDQWQLIRWRGAVTSAIRGRRGQAFLRELRDALDALPDKWLAVADLESEGEYCALGCVGRFRGMDMSAIDPDDYEQVAKSFGLPESLAREIMYENDDAPVPYDNTSKHGFRRWAYMRGWVVQHIIEAEGADE